MNAGMGEFMVVKMINKRWEELRKDIPKMCFAAGVKDPCAVTLAAVCNILLNEAVLAKKLGTMIDIEAAAAHIKEELDQIPDPNPEDILMQALAAMTEENEDGES